MKKFAYRQYRQTHKNSPSGGMLAFLRLSLSSVVSLATAVPLLVLLRTLNARFSRRKERLRTDERSKLRSVSERDEESECKRSRGAHVWTCPSHNILSTYNQSETSQHTAANHIAPRFVTVEHQKQAAPAGVTGRQLWCTLFTAVKFKLYCGQCCFL